MELFPKKPQFSQRILAWKAQEQKQLRGASLAFRYAKGVLHTLEDYLSISRRRRNDPYPLLKLQTHLLLDLILWEKGITSYKQQRDEAATKLASGDPQLPKLIEHLEQEILICQNHVQALRDIGDGIAWRLFDYDRSVLYVLADKSSGKHVDYGGLQAETVELERKYETLNSITVLNDLTHCLKLGDLTTRDGDSFELTEVKTGGKKGSRITRQKQALREVVDFLNTGEKEERGERYEIRQLDLVPKTYFAELRALIERAGTEGASFATFGDHLTVTCLDIPNAVQFGEERVRAVLEKGTQRAHDAEAKGDVIIACPSTQRYEYIRNYVPYSIFPIPDLARAKLATSAMILFHFINLSAVFRLLERHGWKITKTLDDYVKQAGNEGRPEAAAMVSKGPMSIEIPWTWIGRLWIEFLQPDTLVDVLEAYYQIGPTATTFAMTNLNGEGSIWE
jgi:hypothetical protein